jgi:alkanesulfonate monooxygenase SsuD/methylene tetrahydromethanopterin reductase-like flavin-dependent oxidoreductase (luciferase family)
MTVRFGLFSINVNVCATDPAAAVRVAVAAEAAGWESVWTGEHYVLPDPAIAASPAPPETPFLDPFIALANIAAHTSTLRLGTGVTVVPLHHPLMLAKQVASIDRVSGGRFIFGIGVGYLEPEFRALGVPLADRGDRTMDYLDALRAIWAADSVATHTGPYVSFAGAPNPDRSSARRRRSTSGATWPARTAGPSPRATAGMASCSISRPPSRRWHRCGRRETSTSVRPGSGPWRSPSRRIPAYPSTTRLWPRSPSSVSPD